MNCANHPDRERVAFCQNCGKPLCPECLRNVGNSVFCEPCLTARVAGTAAPTGYGYGIPAMAPPVMPGEPNPGIAALLGFIPGVGAMYNEQYAKGIVHLVVFAVLVSLASDVNGIFGIFIAGWEFYMVIEAHHTAVARRDGTPLPNPFGLNDLSERLGFGKAWPGGVPPATPYQGAPSPDPGPVSEAPGARVPPANPYTAPYSYTYVPPVSNWGAPQNPNPYSMPPTPPGVPIPPDPNLPLPYYRRLPIGAIWLIVLGLFFLVGNNPFFRIFHGRFLGPILLVGVGVWLFVRKMTSTGQGIENDGTPMYHWRLTQAVQGSFWVVLTGVIWLLDELGILSWGRSWPLWIIGAGVIAIFRRTAGPGYGYGYTPPIATPPVAATPVSTTDLVRSETQTKPASNDQEGR